jgi:site-specific DNA recombinase
VLPDRYDDGGRSGASLDRPALQALLADVRARKVEVVVVYKVDRLTRSLADFAKLIEQFEAHAVSFVSVTQSFNTTSSIMPRSGLCRVDVFPLGICLNNGDYCSA